MAAEPVEVALVTGASSGIGLELARLFARDGSRVVLIARSRERLDALAGDLRAKGAPDPVVLPGDLAQPGEATRLVDALRARGIEPDVLVNNAGFGVWGRFLETPLATETAMIQVNIVAVTELTKLLLPGMVRRRRGRLMNVASTAAFQPGPLMAVYYATKAYVLSFTEALAEELDGTGVTATAFCPGPTASGFQRAAALEESRLVKGRRLPTSAEVAAAGYAAMRRGEVVYIPGALNWIVAQAVRFIPRSVARRLAKRVQDAA